MARTSPGSTKNRKAVPARTYFDGAARDPVGCRFIMDDDGHGCRGPVWRFCQAPAGAGRSYCEAHQKIVYQPERPKDAQRDAELTKRLAISRLLERF